MVGLGTDRAGRVSVVKIIYIKGNRLPLEAQTRYIGEHGKIVHCRVFQVGWLANFPLLAACNQLSVVANLCQQDFKQYM